ncbi:MAG TPA: cupin domain-containing protein [Burkholderiales bacterium]|nr:cupin domain-containing protein [Burkholderiales bacterium]
MKTPDLTPDQMNGRIARFNTLQPTRASFNEQNVGVPGDAYALIAAERVYSMLAPPANKRNAAKPAVTGAPGLEVVIAQCPPGQGPALHAHCETHEIFICMSGRYEVIWGDKGEHSVLLDPCDMIAVPPGVFRRFRNASDVADAKLLVLVQGEKTFADVKFDPAVGVEVERRWGAEVRENFRNIGITFEAPGSG